MIMEVFSTLSSNRGLPLERRLTLFFLVWKTFSIENINRGNDTEEYIMKISSAESLVWVCCKYYWRYSADVGPDYSWENLVVSGPSKPFFLSGETECMDYWL